MISPFAEYTNATLYFQLISSAVVTDELGNLAPVSMSEPVSAFLKIVTNPDAIKLLQGDQRAESDAIALSGYCVEPMALSPLITQETEATAIFNHQQGRFLLVLINPPYGRDGIGALIESEAGTKIAGWFKPLAPANAIDTGSTVITVPFSHLDAPSKLIAQLAAGMTVFTAQIVITTPFDDPDATLQMGDAEQIDRLITVDQIDPAEAGEWETNPAQTYANATQIFLTIDPAGSTQGGGYAIIET